MLKLAICNYYKLPLNTCPTIPTFLWYFWNFAGFNCTCTLLYSAFLRIDSEYVNVFFFTNVVSPHHWLSCHSCCEWTKILLYPLWSNIFVNSASRVNHLHFLFNKALTYILRVVSFHYKVETHSGVFCINMWHFTLMCST